MSISTNETNVEEGEAVLILFYREEKDSSMTSLEDLKYSIERNVDDWDVQHQRLLKLTSSRCEVVALTHTAKNIGQLNVEIIWYLPSSDS